MKYLKTYESLIYKQKEEIMDNLSEEEKKVISDYIEHCYPNDISGHIKINQISKIASSFTTFFIMNKKRQYIDYKDMNKCYGVNVRYISDFIYFIKLKYNIDEHEEFFNKEEIIIFIGEYIRYISEKNKINYEKFYGLL